MTEDEWLTSDDASELVKWLGDSQQRQLRLFACALLRRYWSLDWVTPPDAHDEKVIAIAEGFADGTEPLSALKFREIVTDLRLPVSRVLCEDASRSAQLILPHQYSHPVWEEEHSHAIRVLRDIFGNPFRPVAFDPAWRTDTAVAVARQMYDSRDFGAMPILADALQDAGCEDEHILNHCRDTSAPHVRGCWVCDLVLNKS